MQVMLVGLPPWGATDAHEAGTLGRDCYAFLTAERDLNVPVCKD